MLRAKKLFSIFLSFSLLLSVNAAYAQEQKRMTGAEEAAAWRRDVYNSIKKRVNIILKHKDTPYVSAPYLGAGLAAVIASNTKTKAIQFAMDDMMIEVFHAKLRFNMSDKVNEFFLSKNPGFMSNEGMKTLYSDPAIRFHPEVGTVENLNAELAFTKATNRLKDAVEIHREGFVTPKANFKYNGNEFELLQSSLKEAKVEFARVAEFEKVRGVYKYSNQQAFKDITKTLDEVIVDAAKVTEDGALMSKNLSKWGRIGRLGYAAVILGVAVTVGSIYVQTESKGMSATDRAASKTDFMGFVIGLPKEQVKKYGLEECYDQYSYMLDLAHKHPEVADEWVKEAVAAAEKMDEENQRNKKLQKSLQSYQDKINIDADPLFPKQST